MTKERENTSLLKCMFFYYQNRFFVNAGTTPTAQAWPLPLTYTTASNPNWVNLQATKVMTTKEDSIETAAGNGWVIFNVQQKSE